MNDNIYTAYLSNVLKKLNHVLQKGEKIIKEIPKMVKNKQLSKHSIQFGANENLDLRVQNKRYDLKTAAALIGVSKSKILLAEKKGLLPEPDYRIDTKTKLRSGYYINQINKMREFFLKKPSIPDKSYPSILGFLNLKGGSQKTTTCHLFSQYLAIQGYKVLVVDTDPQASLSFFFGKRPNDNVFYEDTIAPFLLQDKEALIASGHSEDAYNSLDYAIQSTYWSNIDIIPSCLQNLNIDFKMPKLFDYDSETLNKRIMRLRSGILSIKNKYDFILIDGTPSLNISTLNVFSACDVVFVPSPASMLDFVSTLQFVDLIAETIETYQKENILINIPDVRFFITKYSNSSYAKFMEEIIRRVFNVEEGDVLDNQSYHSDEIGKANNSTYSIYEQNLSESDNRKRLKATLEQFNCLFEEMHEIVWDVCYTDKIKKSYLDKRKVFKSKFDEYKES